MAPQDDSRHPVHPLHPCSIIQQEFLRLLLRHQVRYLVVGGIAVIYHGHARLTGDVDFLYDANPENAHRLYAALGEFWGGAVPALGGPADLLEPGVVVQYGRPPNRIDLLSSISGVTFAEAWAARKEEPLEGGAESLMVPIIGLAELVRNKRAAGRPKDLDDLEFLDVSRRYAEPAVATSAGWRLVYGDPESGARIFRRIGP